MSGCIVCGVDESSGSRRAASVAARLARDLGSPALLVHVTGAGAFARTLHLPRVGRARRTQKGLAAIADEHCFPPGTEVRLERGEPADGLMSIAHRADAELLVVATCGRLDAGAAHLGSVTSTVMGAAPCPVVVVPPASIAPVDATSLQSIVCGVAGDDTDIPVLGLAADLVTRLGGHLYAVHAYDQATLDPSAPGPQRMLNDQLGQVGGAARGAVVPLPAPEALERVAEQQRAGLIVVGSHAHGTRGSRLPGSVATRLATAGKIPVVVLRPGAELEPGSGHYELLAGAA